MTEPQRLYRLVTRSDFDGLVCAVLLQQLDMINDMKFVHPKDMQDGKIEITDNDITTNLPYVDGVHMAFDHHLSETIRTGGQKPNHIIEPDAPSTARVVYNHFGGKETFPMISDELMQAVDQADSAQYCLDDILNPQGWTLLNFIMDPRTGLGRFRNFNISNYNLMSDLVSYCTTFDVEEILQLPDVKERIDLYNEQQEKFKEQLMRCSKVYKNCVVLDLRHEETIYAGNRFMIYALYPNCNISIHVLWGLQKRNTVLATGKSILNRTSKTNVGNLMLQYKGGGHANAGTCQVGNDYAGEILQELVDQINQDG